MTSGTSNPPNDDRVVRLTFDQVYQRSFDLFLERFDLFLPLAALQYLPLLIIGWSVSGVVSRVDDNSNDSCLPHTTLALADSDIKSNASCPSGCPLVTFTPIH